MASGWRSSALDDETTPPPPRRFRRPSTVEPDTPKSNFNITAPAMSSDSSSEEDEIGVRKRKGRKTRSDSCSEEESEQLTSHNRTTRTTRYEGEDRNSWSSSGMMITPLRPSNPTSAGLSLVASPEPSRITSGANTPQGLPRTIFARSPSRSEVDSLFGASGSSKLSEILRRRRMIHEGRLETEKDDMTDTVMAVVWASGQLAAAYYSLDTAEVMLLPDTVESAPDYWVLKSLYNQVMPRYVLVNSRQDQRMIKVLQELTGNKITGEEGEADEEVDRLSDTHSSQLFLLNGKEFSPELCKQRILSLKIPYEPKNNSPEDHFLFISSLIPFRNENMVRAAGALLKFLDKSAIEIFQMEVIDGQVPVVDVNICTMDEMVLVDETAWRSLQIFSTDIHPSSMKQGNYSASKEGISIFSCINRCTTVQGAKHLRLMLLRPCRNASTLQRRYDVIDFCRESLNAEFVKSATDCLKRIKSLPKILYKLSLLHLTVAEWRDLYQSVYNCLLLSDMCGAQSRQFPQIELFREISSEINLFNLRSLSHEMIRVIDFDESKKSQRFVPREGINAELDIRRQQYSSLPDIMELVSREEMNCLPTYAKQCCVLYIPEVGYLLAVTLWRPDLSPEELILPGLEFKFKTSELAYYKSARTKDLDTVLGDCQVSILEYETSIMIILAESVITKSPSLFKIGQLITELDCLLALSLYANLNGFVRPTIVPGDQPLKIVNGRHPLAELICDFVPNSTVFNGEEKVTIITGPNASGKSVYLKQVGIIVIMALAGSFVPASFAQIPTYDRICTRIHATESLCTGFSSFMIDLSQMSLALRTVTKQSLVIVDEFGKGTADTDGLSLLVATVEDFLDRKQNCPTIFLSTHYYSVVNYLKPTPLIKQQSMKFHQQEDQSDLTYLYILTDGMCLTSFATVVAAQAGISKDLMERSKTVDKAVRNLMSTNQLLPLKTPEMLRREKSMYDMAAHFLAANIDEVNPLECFINLKDALSKLM